MIVLISDTSVLIDLERGGLLDHAFGCGFQLGVPDFLYARELDGDFGTQLQEYGLAVFELEADELVLAQRIFSDRSALSLSDCAALSCSLRPEHVLVTGDRVLRNEAIDRGVAEVHGILWLLDGMLEPGGVDPRILFDGLARIAAHPRCRLPRDEIAVRLGNWGA